MGEVEHTIGLLLDAPGNLVAVARLVFEHGQNRQLGAASLD